ncbi:DUF6233 domain-containing protein [Streptomyces sp. NPDC015139]|uniref:DUF6233 domain-containing protein n=1 Tax=Streptomyces sp. NPDC015139 TaxID=3364942 RepID=UPI0036F7FDAA
MSELPPDPPRLILALLDQRLAETETVATSCACRPAQSAKRSPRRRSRRPTAGGCRRRSRSRRALDAPAVEPAGGFVVEKQLHAGHPLGAAVHRAGCTVIQRDANPVSADEARQALTGDGTFFRACEFCRPVTALQIPSWTRAERALRQLSCRTLHML